MALTQSEKVPRLTFAIVYTQLVEDSLGSGAEVVGTGRVGPSNWRCSGGREPIMVVSGSPLSQIIQTLLKGAHHPLCCPYMFFVLTTWFTGRAPGAED